MKYNWEFFMGLSFFELVIIIFLIILCGIIYNKYLNEKLKGLNKNDLIKNEDNQVIDINKKNYSEKENYSKLIKETPVSNHEVIKKHTINIKRTEKEIKNNYILITGAVLVILSSILLLTTTWNTTSNIFKSLILVFILIVFWASSYLAENKLKLKNTALAFKYISLIYLPIVLFSIGLFKILGEYLSLSGDGKYTFLSLISIITTIVYYIESKKINSYFVKILELIMQIITVLNITATITTKFEYLLFAIYIYIIVISYLGIKNLHIYNKHFTDKYLITITSAISIIYGIDYIIEVIVWFIAKNQINFTSIIVCIMFALVIFNVIGNYFKNKIIFYIWPFIANLIIILIGAYLDSPIINFCYILIIGNLIINGIEMIKFNKVHVSTYLYTTGFTLFAYLYGLIISCPYYYIALISIIFISIAAHYFCKNLNTACIYIIPSMITLTTLNIVIEHNLSFSIITILTIIYVLESIIIKNKHFNNSILFNSYGSSIILLIYCLNNFFNEEYITLVLSSLLIITVLYLIKGIYNKINYITLIGFSLLDFFCLYSYFSLYVNHLIEYNSLKFTICLIITTVIITIISRVLNKKSLSIYEFIQCNIISILLYINSIFNLYVLLLFIFVNILLITTNISLKKYSKYIPYFTIIPALFTSGDIILLNSNLYITIEELLFGIVVYKSLRNKKFNIYIIISFIYLLLSTNYGFNKYIYLGGFLLLFIIYYLYQNDNKKIYLTGIYIFSASILINLIEDLKFIFVSSFSQAIILTTTILIIRNVFTNKIIKKTPEYIFTILINLISLFIIETEEKFIYIILLTILSIYAYNKKYGPSFLCSLVFIVINAFIITQNFWLGIPWWVYLLGIGIFLILFAVNNEVKEKKEKVNIIKKLKEKIDI